jgi:hypothetical protein
MAQSKVCAAAAGHESGPSSGGSRRQRRRPGPGRLARPGGACQWHVTVLRLVTAMMALIQPARAPGGAGPQAGCQWPAYHSIAAVCRTTHIIATVTMPGSDWPGRGVTARPTGTARGQRTRTGSPGRRRLATGSAKPELPGPGCRQCQWKKTRMIPRSTARPPAAGPGPRRTRTLGPPARRRRQP